MPDKIVNHFVLADGSTAKYDAGSLVNLDETVSLAGYAPDAKAVGDRLTDVENLAETLNEGGLELKDDVIATNVEDWLDDHPEATTTVQDDSLTTAKYKDNSVTTAKLANGAVTSAKVDTSFLKTIENSYVTPEQFGAVGDGDTDDKNALQDAIDSGVPTIDLNGKTYLFNANIAFSNKVVKNGVLRPYGNSRPTVSNCIFENVVFDTSAIVADNQILISTVENTNNSFYNCKFGAMTAKNFAYQLQLKGNNDNVENCLFEIVRITEINQVEGDNNGVGRHVLSNSTNVNVRNCEFKGFYGGDLNFAEDCDAIHTTQCEHATITGNNFSGYYKSIVKSQYGNVEISENTLNITSRYAFRFHTTPKETTITGNILQGNIGIAFFGESANASITGNVINANVNGLLVCSNSAITFNDNVAVIDFYSGVSGTATFGNVFEITNSIVESNSKITSTELRVYRLSGTNKVNITGIIEATYTGYYSINTGNDKTDGVLICPHSGMTVNNCDYIKVSGIMPSFIDCSHVEFDGKVSSSQAIRNCTDMKITCNSSITSYIVDIYNSTHVIVFIFGTSTGSNVCAINDTTSNGAIFNYVNTNTGIYNRNSVSPVNVVAKSMLV